MLAKPKEPEPKPKPKIIIPIQEVFPRNIQFKDSKTENIFDTPIARESKSNISLPKINIPTKKNIVEHEIMSIFDNEVPLQGLGF
jgi:hypothetical protein